jgi:hypothetical protein
VQPTGKEFSPWQTGLLNAVDIAITGCLLAGGSAGIHKIMQSFTTFLDASAAASKEKAKT